MLREQVITNTWECDNCGTQSEVLVNPYYSISIIPGILPGHEPCLVDFCQTCIRTLTAPIIVQYVDDTQILP